MVTERNLALVLQAAEEKRDGSQSHRSLLLGRGASLGSRESKRFLTLGS